MTSVVPPRTKPSAPGVSRRVFIGVVTAAVLLNVAFLGAALIAANQIVNSAYDDAAKGLCLFVEGTPSSVPLAARIRQQYDCPPYKKPGAAGLPDIDPSSSAAATPARTRAPGTPTSTTQNGSTRSTSSPAAGRRSLTPSSQTSRTPRERPSTATRTATRPGRTTTITTTPARPTPNQGIVGSLCQLVGVQQLCTSLRLAN